MNDKLYVARCLESEVNEYIQTLNDYTLLLTKDTHNLYTKVNGTRLHLATGSTLFSLDQPILKELSVFATNDDNVPLIQDRYYGICGNDDGTYRICESVEYDGELLGVLDSTIPVDGNKYVIKLIENKNVFTDVASETVKWKPVYIGTYQNTIIAVVNPDKLDTVFGIGGVVTDITSNPLVGKFTYNGFLLQATYFARLHTDDEHIKDVVRMLLSDYYTKTEIDVMMQRVTTLETQVTNNTNALNDVYTKNEIPSIIDNRAEHLINKKVMPLIEGKVDISDVYMKDEVYNTSECYNKSEVDSLISTGGGSDISSFLSRPNRMYVEINKETTDITVGPNTVDVYVEVNPNYTGNYIYINLTVPLIECLNFKGIAIRHWKDYGNPSGYVRYKVKSTDSQKDVSITGNDKICCINPFANSSDLVTAMNRNSIQNYFGYVYPHLLPAEIQKIHSNLGLWFGRTNVLPNTLAQFKLEYIPVLSIYK